MELQKIRSLSEEELAHHEKTTAEQLFRLRFQVSMGQNDGVKKLRQLRKEIAQIKTIARERVLGINGEKTQAAEVAVEAEQKPRHAKKAVSAAKKSAPKKAAAKKTAPKKTAAKKATTAKASKAKGAGK
jgi:large subunit ribosomal protein L29